jgi:hypothetical protein
MDKTILRGAELRASLEALMRTGSPVDITVASEAGERQRITIEQVGGSVESRIFELSDGRVAVMVDIAVSNQSTRTVDVANVELRTYWGESHWDWLTPRRVKPPRPTKRSKGLLQYTFPGRGGWQFTPDRVINDHLFEHRKLPGRRRLEGLLLGIGDRMPADLCAGQWLDLSLVIVGSDGVEYEQTIRAQVERLEASAEAARRRTSLFDQQTAVPSQEVAPSGVQIASQGARQSSLRTL